MTFAEYASYGGGDVSIVWDFVRGSFLGVDEVCRRHILRNRTPPPRRESKKKEPKRTKIVVKQLKIVKMTPKEDSREGMTRTWG